VELLGSAALGPDAEQPLGPPTSSSSSSFGPPKKRRPSVQNENHKDDVERLDLQRKNAVKDAANDIFLAKYNSETCPGLHGHRDGTWISYVLHLGGSGHSGGTHFYNVLKTHKLCHKPGDLSVHNGQAFHSAAPVQGGDRYVFVGFVKLADGVPLPDTTDRYGDGLQGDIDASAEHLDTAAKDALCCRCGREDNAERMLLGDNCNTSGATHIFCCTPKILEIPNEDQLWYCNACTADGMVSSATIVTTANRAESQEAARSKRARGLSPLAASSANLCPPDCSNGSTDSDCNGEYAIVRISRHKGCLEKGFQKLIFWTHFDDGDECWTPYLDVCQTQQFEAYCREHQCLRVALLSELGMEEGGPVPLHVHAPIALSAAAAVTAAAPARALGAPLVKAKHTGKALLMASAPAAASEAATVPSAATATETVAEVEMSALSNTIRPKSPGMPPPESPAPAPAPAALAVKSHKSRRHEAATAVERQAAMRKYLTAMNVLHRTCASDHTKLPGVGCKCWLSLYAFNSCGDYDEAHLPLQDDTYSQYPHFHGVGYWVEAVVTKATDKQLEITVPLFNNIKLGWDQYTLAKYFRATCPVKMTDIPALTAPAAALSPAATHAGAKGSGSGKATGTVLATAPGPADRAKHYLFDRQLAQRFPTLTAELSRGAR